MSFDTSLLYDCIRHVHCIKSQSWKKRRPHVCDTYLWPVCGEMIMCHNHAGGPFRCVWYIICLHSHPSHHKLIHVRPDASFSYDANFSEDIDWTLRGGINNYMYVPSFTPFNTRSTRRHQRTLIGPWLKPTLQDAWEWRHSALCWGFRGSSCGTSSLRRNHWQSGSWAASLYVQTAWYDAHHYIVIHVMVVHQKTNLTATAQLIGRLAGLLELCNRFFGRLMQLLLMQLLLMQLLPMQLLLMQLL